MTTTKMHTGMQDKDKKIKEILNVLPKSFVKYFLINVQDNYF
jgi:hypothetical protein